MTLHGTSRGARFWFLLADYFRARRAFQEIYNQYEERVLDFSRRRGVPRQDLRLGLEDIATLIDLHQLERLRDTHLTRLKSAAHDLYREGRRTDPLDRYISDIFHEASILKEQRYRMSVPPPKLAEERDELDRILDEVHEFFPRKVHHIQALFAKAWARVQEILPAYAQDRVFIRSLYLSGPTLFDGVIPGGLDAVYAIMHPALGSAEGYATVGESFHESCFYDQAREAYLMAQEQLLRGRRDDPARAELGQQVEQALAELAQRTPRAEQSSP